MANTSASGSGVTGANNAPVGAAGQPNVAAKKKAIQQRIANMNRDKQREKGQL